MPEEPEKEEAGMELERKLTTPGINPLNSVKHERQEENSRAHQFFSSLLKVGGGLFYNS